MELNENVVVEKEQPEKTVDEEVEVEEAVEATEESADETSEEVVTKEGKPAARQRPRRARPKRERERAQLSERVVAIKRVSKTVKGGRRLRFTALVVVGDGRGRVGFGTGKANEVPDAIKKALEDAKRNLIRVPIVKGDTLPHEIMGKFGACSVYLKPAPQGTGIVAGGPVRAVLELAGVKNIYSKVYGSRTPINIVRATINGIQNLKTANLVAEARGKSVKELI